MAPPTQSPVRPAPTGPAPAPKPSQVPTLEGRFGAHVTRVGLRGTYLAHAGMMDGVAESLEQPHWALLGAIAEGPNGSVFFKLTGPASTVKAASAEFDRMLKSIHKLAV